MSTVAAAPSVPAALDAPPVDLSSPAAYRVEKSATGGRAPWRVVRVDTDSAPYEGGYGGHWYRTRREATAAVPRIAAAHAARVARDAARAAEAERAAGAETLATAARQLAPLRAALLALDTVDGAPAVACWIEGDTDPNVGQYSNDPDGYLSVPVSRAIGSEDALAGLRRALECALHRAERTLAGRGAA